MGNILYDRKSICISGAVKVKNETTSLAFKNINLFLKWNVKSVGKEVTLSSGRSKQG